MQYNGALLQSVELLLLVHTLIELQIQAVPTKFS